MILQGFEDVRLLASLLDSTESSKGCLRTAMAKFSEYRNPDAEAICDLAMYNYVEVRSRRTTVFCSETLLCYTHPRKVKKEDPECYTFDITE